MDEFDDILNSDSSLDQDTSLDVSISLPDGSPLAAFSKFAQLGELSILCAKVDKGLTTGINLNIEFKKTVGKKEAFNQLCLLIKKGYEDGVSSRTYSIPELSKTLLSLDTSRIEKALTGIQQKGALFFNFPEILLFDVSSTNKDSRNSIGTIASSIDKSIKSAVSARSLFELASNTIFALSYKNFCNCLSFPKVNPNAIKLLTADESILAYSLGDIPNTDNCIQYIISYVRAVRQCATAVVSFLVTDAAGITKSSEIESIDSSVHVLSTEPEYFYLQLINTATAETQDALSRQVSASTPKDPGDATNKKDESFLHSTAGIVSVGIGALAAGYLINGAIKKR